MSRIDLERPIGRLAGTRSEAVAGGRGWLARMALADRLASLGILAAVLALAESSARFGWITTLILPAPSDVARALWDGFASGLLIKATWDTFWPTTVGFACSATVAIAVGSLLGSVARLKRVFMPFIIAIQSTPKIAIAPIIVLWLGFGPPSKITIVVVVAFFPVFVSTLQGVVLREQDRVELMRGLGASQYQLFRYLRLPSAVPYIFGGLRIGSMYSLTGAVVAEFVGSTGGLGYVLLQQRALFNVPAQFAVLLLLMVVGLTLDLTMRQAERRIAFWAIEDSSVSR